MKTRISIIILIVLGLLLFLLLKTERDTESNIKRDSENPLPVKKVVTEENSLSNQKEISKKKTSKGYSQQEPIDSDKMRQLSFLISSQAPDGSWSSEDGTRDGAILVTSSVLLAFLSKGSTHRVGAYKESARKAVDYLKSTIDNMGKCSENVFVQSVCVWALDEDWRMTKDSKYQEVTDKAVRYLFGLRFPDGGFPEVTNGTFSDPKTTFYAAWALASWAAKIEEDDYQRYNVEEWKEELIQYSKDILESETDLLLTAMATHTLIYLIHPSYRKHPILKKGWETIEKNLPSREECNDIEYLYFGTYSKWSKYGTPWYEWNKAMKETVGNNDVGEERFLECVWDSNMGPLSKKHGRIYTAAMCELTLGIYCAHRNFPR